MEITEINILSDFEAGIKCLQNTSLFSRFSLLSNIDKLPQLYSFWKWGALILAVFATFTCVINKIKLLIYRLLIKSFVSSPQAPSQQLDDDVFDFSDDVTSSSATESDDDDDEFESKSSSEHHRNQVDEVFRVSGSSSYWEEGCGNLKLRRRNRFSWSDFSTSKSVVQLWDSFGLGLDFEEDSNESKIAIWHVDEDVKISSGSRFQVPAVVMSSPEIILSAEINDSDGVVLGAYDTRMCRKIPAIYDAWRPQKGKVLGLNGGGIEKVYIINDLAGGALTIGDLRMSTLR